MKRKFQHTLFLLFFVFSSCAKEEDSLAIVGNDKITLSIFKSGYEDFLNTRLQKDNLMNRYLYLNSMIDERLILRYAKDRGLKNSPSYIKSKNEVYDQLLLNFYFDKKINSDFDVSEHEIRDLFRWQRTSVHIRHLFSRSKKEIDDIKFRLDAGEVWEDLARFCFQDSILKENGGDLGWYKLGELDPVFEWHTFSLSPNEISDPVRTQDGYSIIHLIESEFDGLLSENDFQTRIKKNTKLVKSYKQKLKLLDFTDKTVASMEINFNDQVLSNLFLFLSSASMNSIEKIYNDELVSFYGANWNVAQSMDKISGLSGNQFSKIASIFDLKEALIGLICRDRFLSDAKNNKIHETKNFQNEINNNMDRVMISHVLNKLGLRSTPDNVLNQMTIKENYFKFKNELTLTSNIKVDSLLVKTFIM